ncbi:hypothetical protein [Moorena sp. SIO4G3]|uniref:hypothetical protein n=1 Tax=Moorena sp. SIO4G3 TaxID=2607821 RepID=UPI00142C1916|nr:hypothetical protein [Moorena sp. SIO4G3]NEO82262.1 hypothetical protein [Moorena sp. SIO4G3]
MSAQKAKLLSFFDRKACTFLEPKRLKPLSVNALRVNQQALFIVSGQRSAVSGQRSKASICAKRTLGEQRSAVSRHLKINLFRENLIIQD